MYEKHFPLKQREGFSSSYLRLEYVVVCCGYMVAEILIVHNVAIGCENDKSVVIVSTIITIGKVTRITATGGIVRSQR
jgi:hypothetical protein